MALSPRTILLAALLLTAGTTAPSRADAPKPDAPTAPAAGPVELAPPFPAFGPRPYVSALVAAADVIVVAHAPYRAEEGEPELAVSIDGGKSWRSDAFPAVQVAIFGGNLYALGTAKQRGLWTMPVAGGAWTRIALKEPEPKFVVADDAGLLVAGAHQLYASSDGKAWKALGKPFRADHISGLGLAAGSVLITTMTADVDGDEVVFRLSRSGTPTDKLAGGEYVCGTRDKVVVAEYAQTVVHTRVAGSWLRAVLTAGGSLYDGQYACAASDQAAYVGSKSGLWRSDWAGHWVRVALPFASPQVNALALAGSSVLAYVLDAQQRGHLVAVPLALAGTGETVEAEAEDRPTP